MQIFLSLNIGILLGKVLLNSILENFVPWVQSKPLKSWKEFINNFVNFVSVSRSSYINLDVIFSDQRLSRDVKVLNI
jgi:hypothetical protein